MKQLVIAIVFLHSLILSAQNFEDSWSGFFSYVSVKSISQGNDKIFVAAENAIFTYDLSTEEIKTISTINGLSGKQISTIYYSENFNLLVIGYENGLIEIVSSKLLSFSGKNLNFLSLFKIRSLLKQIYDII